MRTCSIVANIGVCVWYGMVIIYLTYIKGIVKKLLVILSGDYT